MVAVNRVTRLAALAVAFSGALALAASTGCHRDTPPLPGQPVPASVAPASPVAPTSAPDETEAAGLHFVERITGGARASDPLPLIIGIHGRGGRPDHFGRALSELSLPARVILPYGPQPLGDGFTWFGDWTDDAGFAALSRHAADRLAAMITDLVRRRPTVGKPIVTGFSQGGILTFTLAVLHPEIVGAAFPAGGLLAPPLWPGAWPAGVAMPRIHAFHGAADNVVPVEGARATVRHLVDIGLPAQLTEYPEVRHVVDRDMQRDLVQAIEQAIRAP
jgi:phospholipase/carboxylesterase